MTEASVSFAGNLTDDPEVRSTEGGLARAMFRVAVSGRREQDPSFFTVVVWRDQAEHAAQSLSKGSRVVVVGRLQQRSWTAEDSSARSVVEVVAEELGPSLRWATATTTGRRVARASSDRVWPAIRLGLPAPHGPGTFFVDVDALLPAAAAFPIHLALCAAQELPAVESESASPGLGHGGLLGRESGWIGEGDPEGPDAGEDPGGVVALLGGGHAVQLGQELLAVPPAVLGGQGQGG
jgi:single-strand DNA-binding protein